MFVPDLLPNHCIRIFCLHAADHGVVQRSNGLADLGSVPLDGIHGHRCKSRMGMGGSWSPKALLGGLARFLETGFLFGQSPGQPTPGPQEVYLLLPSPHIFNRFFNNGSLFCSLLFSIVARGAGCFPG